LFLDVGNSLFCGFPCLGGSRGFDLGQRHISVKIAGIDFQCVCQALHRAGARPGDFVGGDFFDVFLGYPGLFLQGVVRYLADVFDKFPQAVADPPPGCVV
jgi:hypothetical protein